MGARDSRITRTTEDAMNRKVIYSVIILALIIFLVFWYT